MKHVARFAGSAAFRFILGVAAAIGLVLVLRWLVAHSPTALAIAIPRTDAPDTAAIGMLLGEGVVLLVAGIATGLLAEERPGLLGRHPFTTTALGFLVAVIPAYGFLVFASEPSVWARVQHRESIDAYRDFLSGSPASPRRSSAMTAIRQLETDWLAANPGDSLAARVLSLAPNPTRRVAVHYMPDHRFEREASLAGTQTTAANYHSSMNAFKESTRWAVRAFATSLSSDVIRAAQRNAAPGNTVRLEVGYSAGYDFIAYEWYGDSGAGRITPIAIHLRVAIYGPGRTAPAHVITREFYPDARPSWSGQMEMHNVLAENVVAKATAVLHDILAPLP